jgi:hypothetical protein
MAPAQAPAPAAYSAAGSLLLADQIQRLAALTESITYRMLELEERLALQEQWRQHSVAQFEADGSSSAQAMEVQLEQTTERLGRIEAALAGLERVSEPERGQGRSGFSARRIPALGYRQAWPNPDSQEVSESDPTPLYGESEDDEDREHDRQGEDYDEGEQPFMDVMDERIA